MAALDKKILIIEDDRAIRRAMEFRLQKEGFEVITAQDGDEGFTKAGESGLSLIILDLLLPKLNGFEVLKRLKAGEATKHIPIVVFSNLSQKTDIDEVKQLGAAAFFIKSDLSIDLVLENVKKFLNPVVE